MTSLWCQNNNFWYINWLHHYNASYYQCIVVYDFQVIMKPQGFIISQLIMMAVFDLHKNTALSHGNSLCFHKDFLYIGDLWHLTWIWKFNDCHAHQNWIWNHVSFLIWESWFKLTSFCHHVFYDNTLLSYGI